MKNKINSYFAILLITLMGSGAAIIIIRVAYADEFSMLSGGNESVYASLRK